VTQVTIRVHSYVDGTCTACGAVKSTDHIGPSWCSGRPTASTEANTLRVEVERLTRERDEARANYAFMVKRAADQRLDGYRELGARAAAAENERDEARAALKRCEEGRRVDQNEIFKARDAMIRDGDDSRWQPGETTVDALIRERDAARAEAAMYKQECASISAEFGLPPTIRPSEGEITRFLEDYRKVRLQAARLRAALEGYHKVAKSIPYAQWTQEQHAADIALNGEKS